MLGKVKEVDDDDDESTSGSLQSSQQQAADAKTIEMLTRENAMLRQQQYHSSRMRPRGASTAAAYGLGNGYGLQESVPEESDFAVDELDEPNDAADLAKRAMSRRMSEYSAQSPFRSAYTVENRKLENVKKAYWQSSLGFSGVVDVSQSRRHSFADVPTRQASINSMSDAALAHEPATPQESQISQEFVSPFADAHIFPANHSAQAYFAGGPGLAGPQQAMLAAAAAAAAAASAYGGGGGGGGQFQSPYTMHSGFPLGRLRPTGACTG